MKLFYVLILLIVSGCVSFNTVENDEIIEEESIGILEEDTILEDQPIEEVLQTGIKLNNLGLNKIKKNGIEITLDSINKDKISDIDNIFFAVNGEDLIKDELKSKAARNFPLRNPLEWKGFIYVNSENIKLLFLCDSESKEDKWKNVFCEEYSFFDNLSKDIIYLIYTTNDILQVGTKDLRSIESLGGTYIFKLQLQKV